MKKEEKKNGMDPTLYNNQMTLKPTQKYKRKNKKTRLQTLYNEGKVRTEEFYNELTRVIKWRLMPDLIRRGYYINGVRQSNFTRDECDACYIHVLHKILNEYSPEKGTLATYVRWQIRGWGQLIIQKQVRTHKYIPKGTVSLDNTNVYNIKLEEYKNRCKLPEDTEAALDHECFNNSIIDRMTQSDIEEVRNKVEVFESDKTCFEWMEKSKIKGR